jgi:hypothetical protein
METREDFGDSNDYAQFTALLHAARRANVVAHGDLELIIDNFGVTDRNCILAVGTDAKWTKSRQMRAM